MKNEKESFIVSTYRFIDSIYHYITGGQVKRIPYVPQKPDVDRTCIILDKGMGDFILASFYIQKTAEHYSKFSEVYIIADEYNYEFFKAYITDIPAKVIVLKPNSITIQNDKSLMNYRGFFTRAVILMSTVPPRIAEILRALSPVEIYAEGVYFKDTHKKFSILDYKVLRAVKTFDLYRDFYCKVHREFCKKLFGEDYGLKIPEPISTERLIPEKYFLVNTGASNKQKLLSVSKFLETARILMKRTNLIPVIIGKITPEELKQNDTEGLNLEYINKDDMNIANSLCRYAEFVITSDTGIYHLALSISGGPKVILPTWSTKNILFEPYPEELPEKYQRLKYIRMYNSCDECPQKCTAFFYKVRKKLKLRKITVPCVSEMKVETIIEEVMNFIKS